jgi:PrtD family type I secretion system ABC transporter
MLSEVGRRTTTDGGHGAARRQSIAPPKSSAHRDELSAALAACRGAFFGVGLFSGVINLLMLTGSFYMLEVYDRVLPSRSLPTLAGLTILAAGLFAFLGLLDLIRGRVLARTAASIDHSLTGRVYDSFIGLPLKLGNRDDCSQPLRDLDRVREFLSGQGPMALFDLPWIPIYLLICFAFHVWIGVAALAGAIVLIGLTLVTEQLTRGPSLMASRLAAARNGFAETSRRNAEAIAAMGMAARLRERWGETNAEYMASHRRASDVASGLAAFAKVFRMMLQSGVLGIGGYLVIQQQATAGVIIASSIVTARALAPIDLAIANWRGFVGARQAWNRLGQLLALLPAAVDPLPLPAPIQSLAVEMASGAPPSGQKLVVQDANFVLKAGSGLGVIGPSASGKSSLARMLVGIWPTARGTIRLDGAALPHWSPEALGAHVGYLPQDVELMAGTVAQNICRFERRPDAAAILAAAKAASVHDLILGLPDAYDTQIGEQGCTLSAGQRQRIALARALYRDPFLVVLDEPNSNLDAAGEAALTSAILGLRARGRVVVVVAHQPSALAGVDFLLVMGQGRQRAFGPKTEIFRELQRAATTPLPALQPTPMKAGEMQTVATLQHASARSSLAR